MPTIDDITFNAESLAGPIDFAEVFGDAGPVELEIGSGKGGFLLAAARAHPERRYFGIEWANEYYKYTADRMARWGVTNVRVARTDGRHFVIHRVPPESLAALHVYHPDPWPKKRHHKRRLINAEFVEAAVRALTRDGRWLIQTDHADYFDVIRGLVAARPELEAIAFASEDPAEGESGPQTNFEVKYRREGRSIHRLAFRRR